MSMRCSGSWRTRSEALRLDRVEVMLIINIMACESVWNNSYVFPGIFDEKTLKQGVQLVISGISKI